MRLITKSLGVALSAGLIGPGQRNSARASPPSDRARPRQGAGRRLSLRLQVRAGLCLLRADARLPLLPRAADGGGPGWSRRRLRAARDLRLRARAMRPLSGDNTLRLE